MHTHHMLLHSSSATARLCGHRRGHMQASWGVASADQDNSVLSEDWWPCWQGTLHLLPPCWLHPGV
jgi:hypothetical protein